MISGIRLVAGHVSPFAVLGACSHHPAYENDVLSAFPSSMQSDPGATRDLAHVDESQPLAPQIHSDHPRSRNFFTRRIPELANRTHDEISEPLHRL